MPLFLRWLLRLGPLNPITVRLVQGGSRRTRHFYIRTIYLGALTVVLLYLLLINVASSDLDYGKLALASANSFENAAYLQIGLITLLAPVFMAGAIAQEANPRTWDILLTTPMSAGEIVLGNLFGRLFFILALLMSSLPLFAITQYFGGVPGRTIFASYLIAACAALVVGSLAIALSVSRLVGKRAVFTFYVCVVSFIAATYGLDWLSRSGATVTHYTAFNPFLVLRALLDPTGYARVPKGTFTGLDAWLLETPVTAFCVMSLSLSVVLMMISTLTVRIGGIAGLGGFSGRTGSSQTSVLRRIFGLGAKGAESRAARLVWHNPIAWREAAARNATFGRMMARWSFILFGSLLGLGVVVYYHGGGMPSSEFRDVLMVTVIGELAVLTLVTLNMAATAVAKEREDGTLDLLLTTPITPSQYLSGKLRGMITYLLPLLAVPVGTLLLAGVYVMLNQVGILERSGGVGVMHSPVTSSSTMKIEIPVILPEAGFVLAIIMIPFLAFVVMVGMHWSLKSKGSLRAVVATVAIVGVISGVVGLCGSQASSGMGVVGPGVGALSPASATYAMIYPEDGMAEMVNQEVGTVGARVALFFGACAAAMIYMGLVYALRSSMVHNFDMTVRRLAGTA